MLIAGEEDQIVALEKIKDTIKKIAEEYNKLTIKEPTTGLERKLLPEELISPEKFLKVLRIGDIKKMMEMLKFLPLESQYEIINNLAKEHLTYTKDITNSYEQLVSHELDLLRIRGASNRELLDAEIALKQSFYSEIDVRNTLDYRLKLEKQITEEKNKQVDVSSETVTLYKIAQEQGVGVARKIAEVLRGRISLKSLFEEDREMFKKYFSSLAEQMEAAEFFGLPIFGKREGWERGGNIPIIETQPRGARTAEELKELFHIELPKIEPSITLNNEVHIYVDGVELKGKVVQEVINQINTEGSILSNTLEKKNNKSIEKF